MDGKGVGSAPPCPQLGLFPFAHASGLLKMHSRYIHIALLLYSNVASTVKKKRKERSRHKGLRQQLRSNGEMSSSRGYQRKSPYTEATLPLQMALHLQQLRELNGELSLCGRNPMTAAWNMQLNTTVIKYRPLLKHLPSSKVSLQET